MIFVLISVLAIAGFLLLSGALKQVASDCSPPPAPSPQILAFAQAIALAEGSDPSWNNPGDLTASFGFPTSGTVNSAGVLKFVNCVDGWSALYQQLSLIISGGSRYSLDQTIAAFGLGYSGGDPNWAKNVAAALGVPTDTQLGDILA